MIVNVNVTEEGVILDFFQDGELCFTAARTFDEWTEVSDVEIPAAFTTDDRLDP